ncbi:galactokinase [Cnuibacter physcomitrellae]|uniref:galactokinase n=1 Tax=Cnuibacter physcomitrellae TaxID=1619308 RepID=UPI002175E4E0|nr:galactokinase [Cnuibacter physcomitrellae]MCS5495734.1 galactokinase [Cnuibacter physcomitrellae]
MSTSHDTTHPASTPHPDPSPNPAPQLVADARRGFEERFGAEPTSLWAAPGRVNLIGEHTDYNDGFVLPFAIDRHTVLAVRQRDDRVVRVASAIADETVEIPLDDLAPDAVEGWSAYPLGVIWAAGRAGVDLDAVSGLDLYFVSDVPVGAGLSSSAAIECATAVAIDSLWDLRLERSSLARIGQLAENEAVGAPTGIMDQSASLLGRADSAVLLDCRSLDATVVPLGLSDEDLVIVVIDTRVSHAHATGGYADRRASCERGAAAMGVAKLRDLSSGDLGRAERILDDETFRRVRHIVTEDERVLALVRRLAESGAASVGDLLDASHASMRDDFEISVPELDRAVETARSAGAVGARMTGGGFGGSAIALVPRASAAAVGDAVRAAFAAAGFREPGIFEVVPSAGAGAVADGGSR